MAWEGSFENSWYKAQFNERMELHHLLNLGKPEKESWSMISVENKNSFMEMIKTAENGDGYILRIYENQNTRTIISCLLCLSWRDFIF